MAHVLAKKWGSHGRPCRPYATAPGDTYLTLYLETLYQMLLHSTLTNNNKSCIGSLATSTVANNTAVVPFIELLYTGNG